MADTKQTESTSQSKDESQKFDFNMSFGNCEEMLKKMKNCCGDGNANFNCCEMMRKMFEEQGKVKSKK